MPVAWLIKLICCGRDDGVWWMPTWDEADKFREDYCRAEGHDRAAILVGAVDDLPLAPNEGQRDG